MRRRGGGCRPNGTPATGSGALAAPLAVTPLVAAVSLGYLGYWLPLAAAPLAAAPLAAAPIPTPKRASARNLASLALATSKPCKRSH
eukprot:3214560-Pyramimonas_sp.AAC.1